MGFITSPSPSNTTEGKGERGGFGEREGRGREISASFNARDPHTGGPGITMTTDRCLHDNGEKKVPLECEPQSRLTKPKRKLSRFNSK